MTSHYIKCVLIAPLEVSEAASRETESQGETNELIVQQLLSASLRTDPTSDFSSFCCRCLQISCSPEGVRAEPLVGKKLGCFFFRVRQKGFRWWIFFAYL